MVLVGGPLRNIMRNLLTHHRCNGILPAIIKVIHIILGECGGGGPDAQVAPFSC